MGPVTLKGVEWKILMGNPQPGAGNPQPGAGNPHPSMGNPVPGTGSLQSGTGGLIADGYHVRRAHAVGSLDDWALGRWRVSALVRIRGFPEEFC